MPPLLRTGALWNRTSPAFPFHCEPAAAGEIGPRLLHRPPPPPDQLSDLLLRQIVVHPHCGLLGCRTEQLRRDAAASNTLRARGATIVNCDDRHAVLPC